VVDVSLGTVAAGALTALGAGLMMLGMGVSPRDVIDGARDLLGGGAAADAKAEVVAREPLTEEQRGAAARIWTEGWSDVSAQEQELLRTSPEWLREALGAKLPAQTIEGYRRTSREEWADYLVPGLKWAQSGCDFMVGMFSTVNPAFGIKYTMCKNVAGGVSEGVYDWAWGKNDSGLVRNVYEGFTRGGVRGGVEIAVDAAAGKAISNPVTAYLAGQVGKYAVGAVGDVAIDWTTPVGHKERPLRAEGFYDTTSPIERDVIEFVLSPTKWLPAGGPPPAPAPRLPHMAQNLVQ
jgi:hypothetical protein